MILDPVNHIQRSERILAGSKANTVQMDRAQDAGRQDFRAPYWAASVLILVCLLVTGPLWGAQGPVQQGDGATMPLSTAAPAAPASTAGRLIDLSALDTERRTTMTRFAPLSLVIAVLAILALVGILTAFLYNGLVGTREQVNAGWAQVENVYQRRLDLIPVLVDTVQTYTEHERETLAELTRARADALRATAATGGVPDTVEQLKTLEAAQGDVSSALARLLAVVENYPDLKASANFLTLQDQIEGTENRVAMERRNFNELARRYNTGLQTFPSNLVAGLMGFTPKPYFQAEVQALQGVRDPFGRHGS